MLLSYMIDSPIYSVPSQAPIWVPPRTFGIGFGQDSGKERFSEAIKTEIQRCGKAQPRWDALGTKALEAGRLVAAERRPFHCTHVLAMIAINKESIGGRAFG
jgi:hypothetical protein